MSNMKNNKLVISTDPILHRPTSAANFLEPGTSEKCIAAYKELADILIADPYAIGLSANQIGLDIQMFVIRSDPVRAFINPQITWASPHSVRMKEGCLSFPGLFLSISRPDAVRVRFLEPDGKMKTERFVGVTARAIQHEIDHLKGITFDTLVGPLALKLARERLVKAKRRAEHRSKSPLLSTVRV